MITFGELKAALLCWYDVRNDPCDKYVGEEGFNRCPPCRMRDRLAAYPDHLVVTGAAPSPPQKEEGQ